MLTYTIKLKQKAQLPLREQGVSLVHSSHLNATLRHLFFEFIYTLRVRFLAKKIRGNACMQVYKNSTHSVWCALSKEHLNVSTWKVYRHKLESMLTKCWINGRLWPPHCRLRPPRHRTPTNMCMDLIQPESRVHGLHFAADTTYYVLTTHWTIRPHIHIAGVPGATDAGSGWQHGSQMWLFIRAHWQSFYQWPAARLCQSRLHVRHVEFHLLLCSRPNRPHYRSCQSVRTSVCHCLPPYGLLIGKQNVTEEPKLVATFPSARVTSVPNFSLKHQRSSSRRMSKADGRTDEGTKRADAFAWFTWLIRTCHSAI